MMPKSSRSFKAVWNGIRLTLTEKEYDIAMSHVERMRQIAADKKYYECSDDDCDEDLIDPDETEEWRLSDTLHEVLKEARVEIKWKGLSDADLIKRGLKKLSGELRGIDPCSDDDADDVF
jgi:hypothetical protein